MTKRMIATCGFIAVVAGSATIMAKKKCRSGKSNVSEGYRRARRGGKRYTVVPSRFL